jgi:hypothetical protein
MHLVSVRRIRFADPSRACLRARQRAAVGPRPTSAQRQKRPRCRTIVIRGTAEPHSAAGAFFQCLTGWVHRSPKGSGPPRTRSGLPAICHARRSSSSLGSGCAVLPAIHSGVQPPAEGADSTSARIADERSLARRSPTLSGKPANWPSEDGRVLQNPGASVPGSTSPAPCAPRWRASPRWPRLPGHTCRPRSAPAEPAGISPRRGARRAGTSDRTSCSIAIYASGVR